VENSVDGASSILAALLSPVAGISSLGKAREADLSTKRSAPEAKARLPCTHVHTRRPRDLEAAPCEGPHAAVGIAHHARKLLEVKRQNRLSRSRDFDAVYRHGRSTASRFLVLYWFPQDEAGPPRFGFSVPRGVGNAVTRNTIKRQLREVWSARSEAVPAGLDYVLIVRPGLPEAVKANGSAWLEERVDEVIEKVAA
jgi:ribonuclease P protein component